LALLVLDLGRDGLRGCGLATAFLAVVFLELVFLATDFFVEAGFFLTEAFLVGAFLETLFFVVFLAIFLVVARLAVTFLLTFFLAGFFAAVFLAAGRLATFFLEVAFFAPRLLADARELVLRDAFFADDFLRLVGFFLVAAFFVGIALNSKTCLMQRAIIHVPQQSGRGLVQKKLRCGGRQIDGNWRCPTRGPIFRRDGRENAAPNVKIGRNPEKSGQEQGSEIAEDLVRDRFMKRSYVAKTPHIKFERFQFDAGIGRNVLNLQCCEVRLSGFGAQACEFRHPNTDHVIVFRVRIGECLECLSARMRGCGFGQGSYGSLRDSLRVAGVVLRKVLLYTTAFAAAIIAAPSAELLRYLNAPEQD